MTAAAHATPVFRVDTEADFASAIGVKLLPLTVTDWGDLDPQFQANMGSGQFVESRIWASPGGTWENAAGEQVVLEAGMGMEWAGDQPDGAYIGGWKYQYPLDPSLSGYTLQFDVMPPNVSPATGAWVNTVGLGLIDANGKMRSWTWTCVNNPPGNGVLLRNWMNGVRIQVMPMGAGGPGDASHGLWPFAGPWPWDLAVYTDNGFDPTLCTTIVGLENGVVPAVGGGIPAPAPPGGTYQRNVWNWWGFIDVAPTVPEPATMILLPIGVMAALRRRRR